MLEKRIQAIDDLIHKFKKLFFLSVSQLCPSHAPINNQHQLLISRRYRTIELRVKRRRKNPPRKVPAEKSVTNHWQFQHFPAHHPSPTIPPFKHRQDEVLQIFCEIKNEGKRIKSSRTYFTDR
jgi:hypothetical protein